VGSCAKLWALDSTAVERLLALPPPSPQVDPLDAAERVAWEHDPAVVLATWRDPADNDLSRIARGERRGLPRVDLLGSLLGIDAGQRDLPWWVAARWPADANEVGLLNPAEVVALRDGLRASAALVSLDGAALKGLEAFLDRATAASCWILGVEGRS
jgi:hypothetical protein